LCDESERKFGFDLDFIHEPAPVADDTPGESVVRERFVPFVLKLRPQFDGLPGEFELGRRVEGVFFAFDLQANEGGTGGECGVPLFFEKIREDEPGQVILRRSQNRGKQGFAVVRAHEHLLSGSITVAIPSGESLPARILLSNPFSILRG
jgi:hypothetical protein